MNGCFRMETNYTASLTSIRPNQLTDLAGDFFDARIIARKSP